MAWRQAAGNAVFHRMRRGVSFYDPGDLFKFQTAAAFRNALFRNPET